MAETSLLETITRLEKLCAQADHIDNRLRDIVMSLSAESYPQSQSPVVAPDGAPAVTEADLLSRLDVRTTDLRNTLNGLNIGLDLLREALLRDGSQGMTTKVSQPYADVGNPALGSVKY